LAKSRKFIAWFNEPNKEDLASACGKGASLAKVTHTNIPISENESAGES
jgi:phosphoenolpyruvate synthase/pyruvate phosphate dikinase